MKRSWIVLVVMLVMATGVFATLQSDKAQAQITPNVDATVKVLRSLLDVVCVGAFPCNTTLKSTMVISVDGGTQGIYIYEQQGTFNFYDQKGQPAYVNSRSSTGWKLLTTAATVFDDNGSKMFYVPAGVVAQFSNVNTALTKEMFEGSYYASVKSLYANTSTQKATSFSLNTPDNKSLAKYIVGEKSPYISSILPNPVAPRGLFTIRGQRLSKSVVYIDGVERNLEYTRSSDGTSLSFYMPAFPTSKYLLHVKDPTTGESNRVAFDVVGDDAATPLWFLVSTDQLVYGPNDLIDITFTAINKTALPVTLNFPNACQVSYTLNNVSQPSICGNTPSSVVIAPFGVKGWTVEHDWTQYPASGTYRLGARINGTDYVAGSEFQISNTSNLPRITVTAPPVGVIFDPLQPIVVNWDQNYRAPGSLTVRLLNSNSLEFYRGSAASQIGANTITLPSEASNVEVGTYRVEVCDNATRDIQQPPTKYVCGMSGTFSIGTPVIPSNGETISVSSPVPGNTYNPAYPLTLSWNQNYASPAITVTLYGNGRTYDLGTYVGKKGTNTYSRQIYNLNLSSGSYSLEACDNAVLDPQQGNGRYLCGQARFFNIGAPGVAPTTSTLTLVKTGVGSGNVIAEGTYCSSRCSLSVPSDKPITISAIPSNPSSIFAGWSGGGCSGTSRTCTVTAGAGAEVTALFDAAYTVSVRKLGTGTGLVTGGDLDCGSTCATRSARTGTITIRATPSAGSVFTGWSGSLCSGTSQTCTITFNSQYATSIHTVNATFDVVPTGTPTPVQTIAPAATPVPSGTPVSSVSNSSWSWSANIFNSLFGIFGGK